MRFELLTFHAAEGFRRAPWLAADEADAREQARRQGHVVLSTRVLPARSGRLRLEAPFDTDLFVQELLALLEAGLGLVESLKLLLERAQTLAHREVLAEVVRSVSEGKDFSLALEVATQSLPMTLVASVRASERTGNLIEGLQRYLTVGFR